MHDDGTTTFRVWAPAAKQVCLVLDDGEHDLASAGRGWYEARLPAGHGTRYGYRLDGGPVLPDPASRWQPEGVHERSAVLDPRRLPRAAAGWRAAPLAGAVIYELHVGTFTDAGTFDAAAERLAELADLGVTHVEVMPVAAYNGVRGWGYDGVAWYAVHEPYGGPDGFAAFVAASHDAGLAVVLDVVYNHLGPSGNYLPEFGPYLTERYDTPWGPALNLDGPDADSVRAFIVDNALQWFADYEVDALRLDAVHGLIDNSATHVLAELADATATLSAHLCRPLQLIAESDRNDPQTIRPREVGGLGLDAQWVDDLHHAIHVAVTREDEGYYADYQGLPDVAEAYRNGFVYAGRYSAYRRRRVGAPLPDSVPGHRLVTCVQNHDQVGNRAAGERLERLAPPELVRVAVLLLCASPTTPMLFMGEEHAETAPFLYFTSHPEPELAEAVRTGRAEEFASFTAFGGQVPDPQDEDTFARSRLDPARAGSPAGRARRALWRDLLRLRREHAALGNGRRDLVEVLLADDERLALVRHDPHDQPVALLVNVSDAPALLPLPGGPGWQPLLATNDPRYGGDGAAVALEDEAVRLPPRCGVLMHTPGWPILAS